MIRVLIVAPTAVARAGLSAALAFAQRPPCGIDAQIEVVGVAADLEILEMVAQLQPDTILLDIGDSPPSSVWEQLHLWRSARAGAIVPIALYDWEGTDLAAALAAGVRGILPDTSTEAELCAAIVAIASGWLVLPPSATELFAPPARSDANVDAVPILTPRELEVLAQIGAGLGNKAIAQNLYISEHTVKFHISSIFQKLDVSTRTEAVTAGIRMGVILL
jgi:two-component system, NarL family, response regulator YdfI